MKKTASILICFILFSSCKKEASQSNTVKIDAKKSIAKIEKFDCNTFFKEGDYSNLCFTDSKLPEHGGDGKCIFSFKTKGNKQEENLELQLVHRGSVQLAEMHYNFKKNKYKKGKTTEVSNVGDAAFFDVHGTDLKSLSRSNKDLHVLYKNVAFVIMAEYKTALAEPCFYSNTEMIAFAKTIVSNLD